MIRIGMSGLVIIVALISTGCDTFIQYTVVNNTDQTLVSWLMLENCNNVIANRDEYKYERVVHSGQRIEVSDVTGLNANASYCVQVLTQDRRLVLSEPYELNSTYIVDDPIERGTRVPEFSELSDSSLWENVSETPPGLLIFGMLGIGTAIAVASAALYALHRSRQRNE